MKESLQRNFATGLGQLKIILGLGVLSLPLLFLILQCFHKESLIDVVDAQKLYKGIGTVSQAQDESGKLNKSLESAGNVFKSKNLQEEYKTQIGQLRTLLESMKNEMTKFESTHIFYDKANGALDNIDKMAAKIFADDWSVSQMSSYMRSVKKNQADFNSILSDAAAEMDSLLAEKFETIEGQKNKPYSSGLIWTLLISLGLGLIYFIFYLWMKKLLVRK